MAGQIVRAELTQQQDYRFSSPGCIGRAFEVIWPDCQLAVSKVAAMAEFFKSSRVWVFDFTYDGRPRRWFKALPENEDGPAVLKALLGELHGERAKFIAARPATAEEEDQYIHGTTPKNIICPTGRGAS